MKKWFFFAAVFLLASLLPAENNTSNNDTTAKAQTDKHVEEQMKREEHFAKTQSFAQGEDYNLSEHQVDPKDLEHIPVMEPQYDLNMDDAYD